MSPPHCPSSSTTTTNNNNNNNNNSQDQSFHLTSDGKLSVNGITLLSQVPNNVTFSPFSQVCDSINAPPTMAQRVRAASHRGGFIGFEPTEPLDRVTNSLGKFTDRNFLSIFRFKTWWSTQWVGTSGSQLQVETQWVMLNLQEIKSYVVIVPIIEGVFRAALRGGEQEGEVMIQVESGSTKIKPSKCFKAVAYAHVFTNPYTLMKEAYSAIRVHLGTFALLEEKCVPKIIDKFGWCTWDAFYLTVDPISIWHGVKEFQEYHAPLRFLVVDDGWQSVKVDNESGDCNKEIVFPGDQMLARLCSFQEGHRFRRYKRGSIFTSDVESYDPVVRSNLMAKALEAKQQLAMLKAGVRSNGHEPQHVLEAKIQRLKREISEMLGDEIESTSTETLAECSLGECGMKAFTDDLRKCFKGLDDIFVWQALCGTWGGVRPGATRVESEVVPCKSSPGLEGTMEDLAVVKLLECGIGLVRPDQVDELYEAMHSYLSSVGITGVKVDVMQALEYVCEEHGGRVELAKRYYEGLTKSLIKNFKGNNLISSMQQCNDFLFLGTKQISFGRVGDDFWFQDPSGDPEGVLWLQGAHMIHCSYNSLWMGQVIHPDWDMFHTDHVCAKFHAGSRAISGGPIYVSDALGRHDFRLLKKLVYRDGTVPVCTHFALPSRDCLFKNPLFDQKTVLKIWNLNKFGGVVGAFNCQGAGWDPKMRRIRGYKECYKTMEGRVHVDDIEWDQKAESTPMGCAEEYIVYLAQAQSMYLTTPKSGPIHVVLGPSSFELFTFVPIKQLVLGLAQAQCVRFGPIGLTNMYNSGGTIQELRYEDSGVKMKVKGEGHFVAYSNKSPNKCFVNSEEVNFKWVDQMRLEIGIVWNEETSGVSQVVIHYQIQ